MPTLPGATAFSEWNVRINGFIATCVESSEAVLLQMLRGVPATPRVDLGLTQQLQQQGLASGGGATNWAAASGQLDALGVGNTAYGPSSFGPGRLDLPTVLAQAVQTRPVLVGVHNAQALVDDWTGNAYNTGVAGHALVAVGMDKTGFIIADPNTPQAQHGGFVHYTAADLRAAGADSLVIPSEQLAGPGAVGATMTTNALTSATATPLAPATSLSVNPLPQPIWLPTVGAAAAGAAGGAVTGAVSQEGAQIGQAIVQTLFGSLASSWPALRQKLANGGFIVAGAGLIFLALIVFFFERDESGTSRAGRTTQRSAQAVATGAQVAALAG